MCFKQLERVLPESFELYIVDNTIQSVEELYSKNLIECLKNFNLLFYPTKDQSNKNIGVAELRHYFIYILIRL